MKNIIISTIAFLTILFSSFIISTFTKNTHISDGRIHLHKPISLPIKTDILKENTLLFLGYAGCPDVCTPRMYEIQKIYENYKKLHNKDDLSVLFISLKKEESNTLVNDYAKSFNDSFIGIAPSNESVLKLTRMLNAYFSRSLTNSETIEHTESLYLIKKANDGTMYLKNIYIQIPYNNDMIVRDIIKDKS